MRTPLLLALLLFGMNLALPAAPDGAARKADVSLSLPGRGWSSVPDTTGRFVPFRLRLLGLPDRLKGRMGGRFRKAPPPDAPAPPAASLRAPSMTGPRPEPAGLPAGREFYSRPPAGRLPATGTDSSVTTPAQAWVRQYSSGLQASNDLANAMAVDRENNVYVAGTSDATFSGGDYLVVKYSSAGTLLWTARFAETPNSFNEATALAVDSAGNVYVTGYSFISPRRSEYVTVKYDSNGARQWAAVHDESPDSTDVATSLAIDRRGNVYVTGYGYRAGTDFDYVTVKYTPDGAEQWSARADGPSHGADVAIEVVLDTAANAYVTGYSQGAETGFDYLTVSYDPRGAERWNARYNSPSNGDDVPAAMAMDAPGDVLVTGSSYSPGSGYDVVTLKYSTLGDVEWSARYNGPANGDDEGSAVACDAAGNVYVAGTSIGSGSHEDFAALKYSPAGGLRWVSRYDNQQGGPDISTGIAVGRYGNVFVTGYARYFEQSFSDYETVGYDSNGTFLSASLYNGPLSREDFPGAIALDADDNVYVTGSSEGNQADVATVKYVSGRIEEWPARYASGAGGDRIAAMAIDPSGNVCVTGSNNRDIRTVEFDPSGRRHWVARFDALPNPVATALTVDAGGNVYMAGYATGASGEPDMVAVKYDSGGVQQWFVRYDGPRGGDDRAVAIAVDARGNVSVAVSSRDPSSGYDYVTLRYDPRGNRTWIDRYNGPANGDDIPSALAVDGRGNVYVTGSSPRFNSSNDYATIAYDSAGVRQWVAYYDGPGTGSDFASAIALDGDGAVYVTGRSFGRLTSTDYATVKYSPLGDQEWVARFNGPGNGVDAATAIAVGGRGDVYVTGYTYDLRTSFDYTTVRYGPDGALRWAVSYDGTGEGVDEPAALVLDRLGNVFVSGTSLDAGTGLDFATVEYNQDGVRQGVWIYNDQLNHDDLESGFAIDSSGGLYAAGSTPADTSGGYFVTKYTSNGSPGWPVRYDGPGVGFDVVNDMCADSLGNVYVTGGSYGDNSSMDFLTVKYDAAGVQQWSARYGGIGATYEEARSIALDREGNVCVTGLGFNLLAITDFVTVKYNADGVQQWANSYNRLGNGYNFARKIAVDNDLNIYVAGYTFNRNDFDITVVKYDSAGALPWGNPPGVSYDGPSHRDDVLTGLAVDQKGNFYVTGYTYGDFLDYVTLKYRGDGLRKWAAIYDGPAGADDRAAALALDSAGNVYVTGTSLDSTYSFTEIGTVAYSAAGEKKWAARYGTAFRSSAEAVDIAADRFGHVYVTGRSYDSTYTYSDFATMAYDTSGAPLWVSRYDGPGHADDLPAVLKLDAAGNVYVGGSSMGTGGEYEDALVKYAPGGGTAWTGRYNGTEHSTNGVRALAIDSRGNVTASAVSAAYRWQTVNTIRYAGGTTGVGGAPPSIPSAFRLFQNYPNPFNPRTTIRYALPKRTHVRIAVYDLLGREVALLADGTEEAGFHALPFDAGRLASGVYFYRVTGPDIPAVAKKMLVIR